MGNERALFVTKLGGILAAVGSAVGLGNIWRFPYETGQNGGAAFLLVYVLCVLMLGTPLMLAELTLGRASHSNAVGAFRRLAPGTYWWVTGFFGAVGVLMIVGFYSVVAGWTLHYTVVSVLDRLTVQDFGAYSQGAWLPFLYMTGFVLLNMLILMGGVQKGIERWSNILMPIMGALMLVLCINSLLLPGAVDGLKFLFHPDFSRITGKVILSAMGQSFFSISMGVGTLLIYGSYLPNSTKMGKTSLFICLVDTLIAILAGIIIFPACFAYGIQPDAGPGLAFITLPSVFVQMPGGYVWSIIFFVLLAIAALTSSISMMECPIAILQEQLKVSRRRSVVIVTLIAWVLGTCCCLSFCPEFADSLTFWGLSLFDIFDKVTANFILPLGGLLMAVFLGWRMDRRLLHDTLTNFGRDRGGYIPLFLFAVRYFAPICILLIFLSGLGLL